MISNRNNIHKGLSSIGYKGYHLMKHFCKVIWETQIGPQEQNNVYTDGYVTLCDSYQTHVLFFFNAYSITKSYHIHILNHNNLHSDAKKHTSILRHEESMNGSRNLIITLVVLGQIKFFIYYTLSDIDFTRAGTYMPR